MPDVTLVPISRADKQALSGLMDEEERAWFAELAWDFSPVRAILTSFIYQNLLPGFVASHGSEAVGYGYYLTHQQKGIIGTVFAPRSELQQKVADELLALMIDSLKNLERVVRIEAQILPFHNLNLAAVFDRQGFERHVRHFLELDLMSPLMQREPTSLDRVVPWNPAYLQGAAETAFRSYQNQADAEICEDYCSIAGCESYVRSLVENPGCGIFLPEASFAGLNQRGRPCGFIICSRTSAFAGMIPQIAIDPSHQGRGLGNTLMHRALSRLKALGMRTVSLTVTARNQRALDWYRRLGFKSRKEFAAYVWKRG